MGLDRRAHRLQALPPHLGFAGSWMPNCASFGMPTRLQVAAKSTRWLNTQFCIGPGLAVACADGCSSCGHAVVSSGATSLSLHRCAGVTAMVYSSQTAKPPYVQSLCDCWAARLQRCMLRNAIFAGLQASQPFCCVSPTCMHSMPAALLALLTFP